jgi:hypothetical protein
MKSSDGLSKRNQNRAQKPEKCAFEQPFTTGAKVIGGVAACVNGALLLY